MEKINQKLHNFEGVAAKADKLQKLQNKSPIYYNFLHLVQFDLIILRNYLQNGKKYPKSCKLEGSCSK